MVNGNFSDLSTIIDIIDTGNKDILYEDIVIRKYIQRIYESYDEFKFDYNENFKKLLITDIILTSSNNMKFVDSKIGFILKYLNYLGMDASYIEYTFDYLSPFIYFKNDVNNQKITKITTDKKIYVPVMYPDDTLVKNLFEYILGSN